MNRLPGIPYVDENTHVQMWFDIDTKMYTLKRGDMVRTFAYVWQMEIIREFFNNQFPLEGEWQKWYKAGRYLQEEMISDFMFQWCNMKS